MEKLGALWLKEGQKGKFMSGNVSGVDVIVFKNGYKKEGKHPDYIVYLQDGQYKKSEEGAEQPPADDDIPF